MLVYHNTVYMTRTHCIIYCICEDTGSVHKTLKTLWCYLKNWATQQKQSWITIWRDRLHMSVPSVISWHHIESRTDVIFHGLFHSSRDGECIINLNVLRDHPPTPSPICYITSWQCVLGYVCVCKRTNGLFACVHARGSVKPCGCFCAPWCNNVCVCVLKQVDWCEGWLLAQRFVGRSIVSKPRPAGTPSSTESVPTSTR